MKIITQKNSDIVLGGGTVKQCLLKSLHHTPFTLRTHGSTPAPRPPQQCQVSGGVNCGTSTRFNILVCDRQTDRQTDLLNTGLWFFLFFLSFFFYVEGNVRVGLSFLVMVKMVHLGMVWMGEWMSEWLVSLSINITVIFHHSYVLLDYFKLQHWRDF